MKKATELNERLKPRGDATLAEESTACVRQLRTALALVLRRQKLGRSASVPDDVREAVVGLLYQVAGWQIVGESDTEKMLRFYVPVLGQLEKLMAGVSGQKGGSSSEKALAGMTQKLGLKVG